MLHHDQAEIWSILEIITKLCCNLFSQMTCSIDFNLPHIYDIKERNSKWNRWKILETALHSFKQTVNMHFVHGEYSYRIRLMSGYDGNVNFEKESNIWRCPMNVVIHFRSYSSVDSTKRQQHENDWINLSLCCFKRLISLILKSKAIYSPLSWVSESWLKVLVRYCISYSTDRNWNDSIWMDTFWDNSEENILRGSQ
jgi:hypothetical protein